MERLREPAWTYLPRNRLIRTIRPFGYPICWSHHTSLGCTDGTIRNRALIVAENLDRIADGLEPLHRVDT